MSSDLADMAAVSHTGVAYSAILQDLIGFNTVSSNSNLSCIDYIDDFLSSKGFSTRRVFNQEKTKANLIAQLGPETNGGIMLSGHTDVVPVTGQDWHSDPFKLLEQDGRFYGRGTSDMKGFLALVMHLASILDGETLKKPLLLVFTYDEEVGCHGAKLLLDDLVSMDHKPEFVLIGEPTNMELVTAHKGICISRTTIRGKPAHACRPDDGINAIYAAIRLISKIETIIPSDRDEAFEPPTATYNVGTITGGNATNIIAEDCAFEWEFRPLPGQDPESVQTRFRGLVEVLENDIPGIQIRHDLDSIVPGLKEGDNSRIASQLQTYMQGMKQGTAAFTTEGGIYQQAGIPAIVCGPGHISQAHQPDEYISVDMMDQYLSFLEKVVATYVQNG